MSPSDDAVFRRSSTSAGQKDTSKARVPTVFLPSTSEDLREYRKTARDAAIQAGFSPAMMEYFTAGGARPPLAACLEKVDAADVCSSSWPTATGGFLRISRGRTRRA